MSIVEKFHNKILNWWVNFPSKDLGMIKNIQDGWGRINNDLQLVFVGFILLFIYVLLNSVVFYTIDNSNLKESIEGKNKSYQLQTIIINLIDISLHGKGEKDVKLGVIKEDTSNHENYIKLRKENIPKWSLAFEVIIHLFLYLQFQGSLEYLLLESLYIKMVIQNVRNFGLNTIMK